MKMNNKGFTLVEIIAGFSLLVVLMVSFVKIIKLSSELTTAAVDAKNKSLGFYERYYSGMNYKADKDKPAFRLSKGSANVVKDKITITEKTDDNSLYTGEKITTPLELPGIQLKKIENLNDSSISRIIVYRYVKTQ